MSVAPDWGDTWVTHVQNALCINALNDGRLSRADLEAIRLRLRRACLQVTELILASAPSAITLLVSQPRPGSQEQAITGDGADDEIDDVCRNCGGEFPLNVHRWCAECEAADLKDLGHFGDEGSVA